MKIYHDDDALDIIRMVNKLLKKHGLWFEDISPDNVEYLEYQLSVKEFDTSDV